ncbi:MAG: S8 family serine peptidase [Acidimicrobiales bacterium]
MRRVGLWSSVVLVAALVLPAVPTGAAEAPAAAGSPLIVRFDPGATAMERSADLRASGLDVVDHLPGSDYVLALPGRNARPQVGGAIADLEPLTTYRAMGVPNDTAFSAQWHLPAIDAVSAWDRTVGTGTVVAVLDTGIAYEDFGMFHQAPDLAGTAFVDGWDFIDGDAHADDENGHGTHVASTIAATTNNSYGVAGVAPGVTIMPIRVLDEDGGGSDWAAAQGLRFAADHGADIANLSFGSDTASNVMADAVNYARARGVTIVAASGNENGPVSSPAIMAGVIAVGAVRYDLTRAPYSNFGPTLDLVAPGGDLSVDQNHDGYGDGILQEAVDPFDPAQFDLIFRQGTSMATPQVSAVAALVHALGATSPDKIEQILKATAVDLGPAGRDDLYGNGLVQSGAAVRSSLLDAPFVQGIEHACPSESTPPAPFKDLNGSVHQASVGCVAWWEVASGTTADTYEPNGTMTRAQLASFVARELAAAGLTLPSSPPDAFTDDEGSVHELRINQLAAIGVVNGRGNGLYEPGATVTRAEMATFLVRAHDQVASQPLPAGPDAFTDDNTSVHQANINKVAAAGLAAGTSEAKFSPSAPVLRGQMATFLARLLDRLVETGATAAR